MANLIFRSLESLDTSKYFFATYDLEGEESLANAAWELAGETHNYYLRASDRLKNWKNILSTAPIFAMNFAFIPICVAEYYFSREIYRDISRKAPWAIAIGLIAIGVVISELFVYRFFPQKRAWKKYELRHQDENKSTQTNESIDQEVKRYANSMAIIGLLLGIAIVGLIYFFSKERANRELAAQLRDTPFGIQDFMPIGLYFFEILTGCFIWFSFKMAFLYINIWLAKRKLNKEKKKCIDLGSMAAKKFEDAEEYGLDIFSTDADQEKYFSTVIFRNKEGNFTDDNKFFEEPQPVLNKVSFRITDNLQPVFCSVFISTEYKIRDKKSTDPVLVKKYIPFTPFGG